MISGSYQFSLRILVDRGIHERHEVRLWASGEGDRLGEREGQVGTIRHGEIAGLEWRGTWPKTGRASKDCRRRAGLRSYSAGRSPDVSSYRRGISPVSVSLLTLGSSTWSYTFHTRIIGTVRGRGGVKCPCIRYVSSDPLGLLGLRL